MTGIDKLRREIQDLKEDGEDEDQGIFAGDIHIIFDNEDNSDLDRKPEDTVIEFTTVEVDDNNER